MELDRQRLEMARTLGASDIIEVPVFGPNKFQDLSPIMTPREIEERLLVAELKELAPDVQRTGINLMLEPCNQKETHFMYLQSQAAGFIEAVGAPGFKLLSDFYHMQLEETRHCRHLEAVRQIHGLRSPGGWQGSHRARFAALRLPSGIQSAQRLGIFGMAEHGIQRHR